MDGCGDEEKTQDTSRNPETPACGRNSPILRLAAFRGATGAIPWGGAHHHPAPNAETLNTRNRRKRGRRRQENAMPAQESLNPRLVVAIPLFLRHEAFVGAQGVIRGRDRITANGLRGDPKYAKPRTGVAPKAEQKTGRWPLKFRFLVAIPILAFRSAPWGPRRRSSGGPHRRPTPNAETLNTRNRRRWGRSRKERKRPIPQSINFGSLS